MEGPGDYLPESLLRRWKVKGLPLGLPDNLLFMALDRYLFKRFKYVWF